MLRSSQKTYKRYCLNAKTQNISVTYNEFQVREELVMRICLYKFNEILHESKKSDIDTKLKNC